MGNPKWRPDPAGDDTAGPDGPAHSTGWVAQRLGVPPATLRTWHRRYLVGPTGRTTGGHRRYLTEDLHRLERMRRLISAGAPTAEAARASANPDSAPRRPERSADPKREVKRLRRLTDRAMALDQPAVSPLLAEALRRRGVAATWTELIVPVLAEMGGRFAAGGDCIAVEHLFTDSVRTALAAFVTGQHRWDGSPPVLLACADQEQHSLPLHALDAALSEIGCPSRILGASVPADALVSAAQQVAPRAVFVWSQTPATARLADLHDLARSQPPTPVVIGGPGWQDQDLPGSVMRVNSLIDAVSALSREIVSPVG